MAKSTETGGAPEKAKPVEPILEQPTQTLAVGGAAVPGYTEIPNAIYSEAMEENRQINFVAMIGQARTPTPEKPYVAPPIPDQIAKQTELEMAAGKARNAEFVAIEEQRLRLVEQHKNDRWAEKPSEQVFRPNNHVPDPTRPINLRSVQAPMTAA